MIKKIIVRLLGKRIDAKLDKWGISKTKIVAVIAVIIFAVENLSPVFGHPVTIPNDVYNFLAGLGLWSLKDGQDNAVKSVENPPA